MTTRSGIRFPRPGVLIVVGVLVAVVGVLMLRSGVRHQKAYEDFQQCMLSGNSPVCLLYSDGSQADSASSFKSNFENQFLIGRLACGLGLLAIVVGLVLLVRQRVASRRSNGPGQGASTPTAP